MGIRVRDARLAAGMTQEDLAARCGLHRTYVGAVERGENNITVANLVEIATALGVEPALLLEEE
jgi:transcriptional regulator with XRE-family HTH domain